MTGALGLLLLKRVLLLLPLFELLVLLVMLCLKLRELLLAVCLEFREFLLALQAPLDHPLLRRQHHAQTDK